MIGAVVYVCSLCLYVRCVTGMPTASGNVMSALQSPALFTSPTTTPLSFTPPPVHRSALPMFTPQMQHPTAFAPAQLAQVPGRSGDNHKRPRPSPPTDTRQLGNVADDASSDDSDSKGFGCDAKPRVIRTETVPFPPHTASEIVGGSHPYPESDSLAGVSPVYTVVLVL